ncbi:MAG: TonB-dependent receptor [Deltaproteobacteria bacterium]|nr:TonB-dependent receptor [Deltaproteobacteria bacterium]
MSPLAPVILALAFAAAPDPEASPPEPDADHKTTVRPGPALPPASAVIGADRLAREADLTTVLDGEVGLRVTRLGGLGSYATLSIRGSTPEQVRVVLDGVPLDAADGAPVDLSSLPLGPLDAVALYRGRSPWIFGDAIGGVLALRSRSPRRAQADMTLGVGSFDTRLARGWVAGALGEAVHLGVALDYGGSAGDFRFVNDGGTAWTSDDDVEVGRQNADFDQASALVKVLVDLGDDATLTVLDLWTLGARGLPGLGVHPTRASRFGSQRNLTGARLDARAGALRIGALAHLGWSEATVEDPRGEIGLGSGTSTRESLVGGATLDLSAPLGDGPLRWTPALVLQWRHEDHDGTGLVAATRELASVAASLGARHAAGVEASLGARLEVLPEVEPSARAELATTAIEDVRLSLSGNLSHRLPSLFELYGDTGTTLGQPDLRPERAWALELGARWDPAPDVGVELFGFVGWHEDLIQIVQNAQGVVRPENVSSARIAGLELAAEAVTLGGHLAARAGLTLLDAIDTSDIAARTGERLPLRPPVSLTARLEGRLGDVEGPGPRLGVWAEVDHTAGNVLDFANLVRTPARTLVGAGLFVEQGPVRVDASVSNLGDARVVDLAGYPLPGPTALVLVRLTP